LDWVDFRISGDILNKVRKRIMRSRYHERNARTKGVADPRTGCLALAGVFSFGNTLMSSPLRYADVDRELKQHGWKLVRISGSHHIDVKEGEPLLSIPVKQNKVKPCYARKIEKACSRD
jgi:predicted RNA binding protein YcfA (HicA-like mRNA interferase family)